MVHPKLLGLALAGTAVVALPAHAADNAMKVCGAKYQAAKTAKTLPAGQTWPQFLAQCRGSKPTAVAVARPAPAPSATPGMFARMMGRMGGSAAKPAAASVATARTAPAGGGAAAMHARERQCGEQWRAAKAAGHVPVGQTWPQYWSQCNTRLKS